MKTKLHTYTIREAAQRCGFKRPNTFREKFLDSPEAREAFGADYDQRGRLVVDRQAVDELAERLKKEREQRKNWRVKNLGDYARPGPRRRDSTPDLRNCE